MLQRLAGHAGLLLALVLLRLLTIRAAIATARFAARLPGRRATAEEAEAAHAAVDRAAHRRPGRAACLEESLAAYLHRRVHRAPGALGNQRPLHPTRRARVD
ncbi:lasso peptide biosynthesis B2 protein [Streptomyces sp. NPDC059003]|uniref:lasso peptide biosynthesis B2 protein n=1 Tax=Streptomyces sp. NPDC059003 TaxID=3346691 RepID=UPI0036B71D62